MELIVNEMETRSAAMPSNASSMSRRESIAIPTRPTSPSARGSSESSPSCVGRSKATLSASWPWRHQVLEARVGLRGRAEADVLPHRPHARAVHVGMDPAGERVLARVAEVATGSRAPPRRRARRRASPRSRRGTSRPAASSPLAAPPSTRPSLRVGPPERPEVRHDLGQRRSHREDGAAPPSPGAPRRRARGSCRRPRPRRRPRPPPAAARGAARDSVRWAPESTDSPMTSTSSWTASATSSSGVRFRPEYTTSMPASRSACATTLAPRSCPSRPGFAIEDPERTVRHAASDGRREGRAGIAAAPAGRPRPGRGASRTRAPTASAPGRATPTSGANTRSPATSTIANTSGRGKPAGTPVSWTLKPWTGRRAGRSTQSKASDVHAGQKPRGGQSVRPQPRHRVVVRRPSARCV